MSEVRLPGFELIEKIGEGGMGQVWKARQLSLDRIVAIKYLSAQASSDPENLRQLIQEARTAAKLKHPGIVQVYDASELDGSFYFVMEYVAGYNIGQWLARKKVLSCKDTLVVIESVAAALDYAWHSSGLIHCDIKPENIMIDQDGTIKVADLGLSLTKDSQTSKPADEVSGTPGYISPEQALGEKLDCRTDIYSLGCCLYQMVTGKRPFRELSDHEAMEAQVSSTIQDPRELVPGIPAQVCGLIERMLVKDRDHRIKDWDAVLADVHRVQKGFMPAWPAPEEGASTMRRRTVNTTSSKEGEDWTINISASSSRIGAWVWSTIFIVVAVAATGWWYLSRPPKMSHVIILPPPHLVLMTNVSSESVTSPSKATPPVPDEAGSMAKLRADRLARQARATESELMAAQDEIRRVVADYMADGALNEAIQWLENYNGRWAQATSSNRMAIVKDLKCKIADVETVKTVESEWQAMEKNLVTGILSGKFAVVRQNSEVAGKDPKFQRHQDVLTAITKILGDIPSLGDKVLDTFSKDIGSVVTIKLGRGTTSGRVMDVRDRKVLVKTTDGMAQLELRAEDMAMSERLSRLESVNLPEAFLIRGVTAYNDKHIEEAVSLLAKSGPVLGPLLVHAIQFDSEAGRKAVMMSDEGMKAFSHLIKDAGVPLESCDVAVWQKALAENRMSRETATSVDRELELYLSSYGNSSFVQKNPELILALQTACGKTLDEKNGDSNAKSGDVLSKIAASVVARNPGVNSDSIMLDDSYTQGNGVALRIVSSGIQDLSPFAGFNEVSSLTLEAGERNAIPINIEPLSRSSLRRLSLKGYTVSDITKLGGLKVRSLLIPNTPIKRLGVLSGLPLVDLDISGSDIADLLSLQGMKLESLNVANTKIASIVPLRGMPLKELDLKGTAVRDLTYLQGFPLEKLSLAETAIFDFSALRSYKLTSLNISGDTMRDIAFCADMPLEEFIARGATLPSLAPLKGKTLRRLCLAEATVKDFSGIKNMTVRSLDLAGIKVPVSVLIPLLAHGDFEELNLANLGIDKISFLKGCHYLRKLNLSNTRVSDLTALGQSNIEELNIRGTGVDDISVLRTLNTLRRLETDLPLMNMAALARSLPKLRSINEMSAEALLDRWSEEATSNKGEPEPRARKQ